MSDPPDDRSASLDFAESLISRAVSHLRALSGTDGVLALLVSAENELKRLKDPTVRQGSNSEALDNDDRASGLSPREQQILAMIVDGLSTRDIARQLGLSRRTVEIHRAHIMQKFGAHNVATLIKIAMAKGLIV